MPVRFCALCVCCLLLCVVPALAVPVKATLAPGQEALLGLGQAPDDTAVRVRNDSANEATVEADFDPDDTHAGQAVQQGFLLLDGSLLFDAGTIPQGELRARYRIEFDPQEVRASRIRAGTLRLMRFDVRASRWVRAVRNIRARVRVRRLRDQKATFTLGEHGYFDADRYVWGVLDVSSQYAVGGLAVPEPLGGVLLLAGGALLVAGGVRRPRRDRAPGA